MAKNSKSKSKISAQSKSKSKSRAAAVSNADALHAGKQWEWRNDVYEAGQTLTGGAQQSNDICYAVENSALTINALLAKFGQSNKAQQNIGYSVAAGLWTITGYVPAGKIRRADKQAQRDLCAKLVKSHGNCKLTAKKARLRKSELKRS